MGVEFTRGSAPAGSAGVLLRVDGEELRCPVRDGVFWLVRWDVADTDERVNAVGVVGFVADDT